MQADYKILYDSCSVKFLGFVNGNYNITAEANNLLIKIIVISHCLAN